MNYQVVPITESDRQWLDELRRAAYRDLFFATWGGWDEERHLRHFAKTWERGEIGIIELDGDHVGMIQLLEHADRIEVAEIQVHPSHQGCGIGTRLLQDTLARARACGKRVSLSTGLQNHGAVRLYERLGFRLVSRSDSQVHMESEPRDS